MRVSFHVRRAKRGYVRFYGTVAPADPGAQVGFRLLRPGKSVNEGGTIVRAGTSGVGRRRHDLTPATLAEFEEEYGPIRPPDGEG